MLVWQAYWRAFAAFYRAARAPRLKFRPISGADHRSGTVLACAAAELDSYWSGVPGYIMAHTGAALPLEYNQFKATSQPEPISHPISPDP